MWRTASRRWFARCRPAATVRACLRRCRASTGSTSIRRARSRCSGSASCARAGGTGGSGSFQDVVVAALAPGHEASVALTVGFRPRAVQFDAAGARAYVITEDGVSVIELADATQRGPHIVPPIAVADATVPPEDLEVQIVATGDYAV